MFRDMHFGFQLAGEMPACNLNANPVIRTPRPHDMDCLLRDRAVNNNRAQEAALRMSGSKREPSPTSAACRSPFPSRRSTSASSPSVGGSHFMRQD